MGWVVLVFRSRCSPAVPGDVLGRVRSYTQVDLLATCLWPLLSTVIPGGECWAGGLGAGPLWASRQWKRNRLTLTGHKL